MCNPIDADKPDGDWNCTTDMTHKDPPGYPKECKAFEGYTNMCLLATPIKVIKDVELSDCCD